VSVAPGQVEHVTKLSSVIQKACSLATMIFTCSSRNLSRDLGEPSSPAVSESIHKGEASMFLERQALVETHNSLAHIRIYNKTIRKINIYLNKKKLVA
jgi:hypothetical protein